MHIFVLFSVLGLLIPSSAVAEPSLSWLKAPTAPKKASTGEEVVFSGVVEAINADDKKRIYSLLSQSLDLKMVDGKLIDGCDEEARLEVTARDLNGDGVPEIEVAVLGQCFGGMTGFSTYLYIKPGGGQYEENLGWPGGFELSKVQNRGFPDLISVGRGFCRGIHRWRGQRYMHLCNFETGPGGCSGVGLQCGLDVRVDVPIDTPH